MSLFLCVLLAQEPKLDLHGDPLPPGATARLGSLRFRAAHHLIAVALSADGKVVAALENGGEVSAWDAATGRLLRRCTPDQGPATESPYRSPGLAVSSDGRLVAAGSLDDRVRVWDLGSGKEVFSRGGFDWRANAVAFSPDGKRLAVASGREQVLLADLETGRVVSAADPPPQVGGLSFSPDGRVLAAAGAREIRLLDPALGTERRRMETVDAPFQPVFSSDGRRLAACLGRKSVRVWDTATGGTVLSAPVNEPHEPFVQFSADGASLIYNEGPRLQTHPLTGGAKEVRLELESLAGPFAFAPAADLLVEADNHQLRLWKGGRELETPAGHADVLDAVALSPDGRVAATPLEDAVLLWDAGTGRLLRKLPFPSKYPRDLVFSPDGRRLVAGGVNAVLAAWDAATGDAVWPRPHRMGGSVVTLAWSPDGARIAAGSAGGRLALVDAVSGALLVEVAAHEDSVNGLAWLDARTVVSGGGDHLARCWDAKTGKELGVLRGHTSDVSAVATTRDGSRVVTASIHMNAKVDGSVRVWESYSGRLIRSLDLADQPTEVLALGPDGRRLFTFRLFFDEVRVWDLSTGRRAGSLPGHSNGGHVLSLSADGRRLLSGGMDAVALVWDLPAPPAPAVVEPAADLERAWEALLSAPMTELDAVQDSIVATGSKAVDFLLPRLRPVPLPEAERPRVEAWMHALESDDPALRAEAVEKLERSPWTIEPLLTGEALFLEARELQQRIRATRNPPPPRMEGEALRRRRALLLLERLGAKAALKELAPAWPAAADALERLR